MTAVPLARPSALSRLLRAARDHWGGFSCFIGAHEIDDVTAPGPCQRCLLWEPRFGARR